jgi:hypothetical protein
VRIAITGISGRFGRLLARRLHRRHAVVGIDRRPYHERPADVELHQIDIRRQRCEDIFRAGAFDAVVHLNVMHDPRASSEDHHTFNIRGTTRVMEYCVRYAIPKLVLLSSANVYGPRAENPQFLTEDAPLMGGTRFGEIRDLIALDMCAQSFFWKHPDVDTVILRPVHIVGAVRNAPSNYLRLEAHPASGRLRSDAAGHPRDRTSPMRSAPRWRTGASAGSTTSRAATPCRSRSLLRLSGERRCSTSRTSWPRPPSSGMWRLRLTSFPGARTRSPEATSVWWTTRRSARRAASARCHDLDATMAHLRLTAAADLR